MHNLSHSEKMSADTEQLVRRIPFFNHVYEESVQQFNHLMQLSDIVVASPGETVIQKGDQDLDAYFLLKGQLGVFLDDNTHSERIGTINPGNIFGVLSTITATHRSAFIICDDNSKSDLLFKLDITSFDKNSHSGSFTLSTKLMFYRMLVHNIRWTLELNKIDQPDNSLVDTLRKLPMLKAEKNTEEELQGLKQQARDLSEILLQWNQSTQAIQRH